MKSLYAMGVRKIDSVVGPYRERASQVSSGAMDFYRGGQHFYRKAYAVGGPIENWLVRFLKDVMYAILVAGGAWIVITAVLGVV